MHKSHAVRPKGRLIAIEKMPTARTATPGSISRTATRSRFLSRLWRQWNHKSTDATNTTRTHHARAFGWLLQGTGTTTRDQSRSCPKSLSRRVSKRRPNQNGNTDIADSNKNAPKRTQFSKGATSSPSSTRLVRETPATYINTYYIIVKVHRKNCRETKFHFTNTTMGVLLHRAKSCFSAILFTKLNNILVPRDSFLVSATTSSFPEILFSAPQRHVRPDLEG